MAAIIFPANPQQGDTFTAQDKTWTYNGRGWVLSASGIQGLVGPQGPIGLQGIQGINGPQGLTGIQGLDGLQGPAGPQGTEGVQGIEGIQGLTGIQGLDGLQGTQGVEGPQGTTGIQGAQGTDGLQGTQGVIGPSGIQSATAPVTYNPETQTVTLSGSISDFNTALSGDDFATLSGVETLSNKILRSPEEIINIVASAATGTINFDALTAGVWFYTSNASANFTLNFRGNSGTTLASALATGDAVTVVFLNTNGATPYYPTTFQIDGSAVTPKWQGGTAPTAGNASSIDAYTFTIIKTAATPTYTVLGAQTKFA